MFSFLYSIASSKLFPFMFSDLGSVEGIVYEPVNNFLFWTCNSNSTINKLQLSNKKAKPEIVVQLLITDKPRGIDIDSCDQ